MKIQSLDVQGFRSFAASQEVNFAALKPGLYHLAGVNELEPALEGNGAGKSSLLEAVCWGLYGRTSRNITASALKNWSAKEKQGVILEVQAPAGTIGIFRMQSPNMLEASVNGAEGKPVDQKELDVLLGSSVDSFLYSQYFAQFTPAFIDLKPSEQMALYSSVLGLDLWEQAAEHSVNAGRALEGSVQGTKATKTRLEGQIEEVEGLSFDAAEQEWAEGMEKREQELTGVLATLREQLSEDQRLAEQYVAGAEKFTELCRVENTAMLAEEVARREVQRVEALLTSIQRRDIKNCPTCGALLSNNHLKEEATRLKGELKAANDNLEAVAEDHKEKHNEAHAYAEASGNLRQAEKEIAGKQADIRNAERSLERLNAEVSPFDKQREETAARLKKLKAELAVETPKLEKLEAELSSCQFWAKGFKELRLSLIEESLAQLSVECNTALVELGLLDWTLKFDVERETKKGTVSKGFTVWVQSPYNAEPVSWNVWSGGESQRLRIAATLGFAELIASRMSVQPDIEFWDEPSQWLSTAGISDLLSSLKSRAERRGKRIIVADHRVLEFSGFAGSITVTKTAAGSSIKMPS